MSKEQFFEFPSKVLSAMERIIYQSKSVSTHPNPLMVDGFLKLQSDMSPLTKINKSDTYSRNKYLDIFVYDQASLLDMAHHILTNSEITKTLLDSFGMKFSIDYIFASSIKPIPEEELQHVYFANHFHRDITLSYNTVKLFVALETIDESQGPTEWLSKKDSEELLSRGFKRGENLVTENISINKFTGEAGTAIMLLTRSNIHKAGVPQAGKARQQIMFQLNPARDWGIHRDIYQRQFAVEPNLSLLRNSFKRQVIC